MGSRPASAVAGTTIPNRVGGLPGEPVRQDQLGDHPVSGPGQAAG
jgi:hypothetical protein